MCQVYDEKYESRSFRGGVIVAQRLSEGDLPDHWIKTIKDVRVVCLPLLFESDHPNRHPKDARREGELLSVATMLTTKAWDRSAADMTQADLEAKAYELAAAFAKRLGDGAAGQLQQRPVPRGGVLFHKEWFTHRYAADPLIMAAECDEIAISADLAVKAKKNNDPNSMLVWGKRHRPRGYFLLGRINKRMEFTDQFMALRQLVASQERCHLVLVEEKQLGPAMVALLRSEIPIPVIGYDPKNVDKESRAKAVFPLWESGMVFLPTRDNCPWIDDYIREHLSFPRGRHDDDVDATTQMLTYWWLQSGEMAGSDVPRAKETLAALTGALHRMTQGAQGGFMR
jgi:predicted phage terminase large subunit-like protein